MMQRRCEVPTGSGPCGKPATIRLLPPNVDVDANDQAWMCPEHAEAIPTVLAENLGISDALARRRLHDMGAIVRQRACDICSNPAKWTTMAYNLLVVEGPTGKPVHVQSDGVVDWWFCNICRGLVDRRDRHALTERSVKAYELLFRPSERMRGFANELHSLFFDTWTREWTSVIQSPQDELIDGQHRDMRALDSIRGQLDRDMRDYEVEIDRLRNEEKHLRGKLAESQTKIEETVAKIGATTNAHK